MQAHDAPVTRRGPWPWIVVGLLLLHASIIFRMIYFAVGDPGFAVVGSPV